MTDEQRAEVEHASRFGLFERALIGALALLTAAIFLMLAQILVPYRPVIVYEIAAVAGTTCAGETVEVRIDWEVRRPIERLEVDYAWSRRGGAARENFGGSGTVYDLEATPRRTIRSPVARRTPAEPGTWRMVTRYEAYGRRWGFPLRQDTEAISENLVTVLPEDDPRCKEGRTFEPDVTPDSERAGHGHGAGALRGRRPAEPLVLGGREGDGGRAAPGVLGRRVLVRGGGARGRRGPAAGARLHRRAVGSAVADRGGANMGDVALTPKPA